MKNTKDFATVVAEKKATLEVLEALMDKLSYEEEYVLLTYEKVGEEQRKDADGNLLYIDGEGNRTTEPTDTKCMKDVYADRKRTPDELNDRDLAKIAAIEKIRETLAAMA